MKRRSDYGWSLLYCYLLKTQNDKTSSSYTFWWAAHSLVHNTKMNNTLGSHTFQCVFSRATFITVRESTADPVLPSFFDCCCCTEANSWSQIPPGCIENIFLVFSVQNKWTTAKLHEENCRLERLVSFAVADDRLEPSGRPIPPWFAPPNNKIRTYGRWAEIFA